MCSSLTESNNLYFQFQDLLKSVFCALRTLIVHLNSTLKPKPTHPYHPHYPKLNHSIPSPNHNHSYPIHSHSDPDHNHILSLFPHHYHHLSTNPPLIYRKCQGVRNDISPQKVVSRKLWEKLPTSP